MILAALKVLVISLTVEKAKTDETLELRLLPLLLGLPELDGRRGEGDPALVTLYEMLTDGLKIHISS